MHRQVQKMYSIKNLILKENFNMSNYQPKPTEVITGEVRFSFVNLLKPNPDGKYSATILLPKSDVATKAAIDAAIEAAKQNGKEKWGGVIPPIVQISIHDGDGVKPSDGLPFGPECKGHWVFTATTGAEYPPVIVDASFQRIIDPTQIYSGMYGRIALNFAPYLFTGKKGVGVYINTNVMKTRDGEPLGYRPPEASAVFGGAAPQQAPMQQPQYQQVSVQPQYQQPPAQQYQQVDPITGALINY